MEHLVEARSLKFRLYLKFRCFLKILESPKFRLCLKFRWFQKLETARAAAAAVVACLRAQVADTAVRFFPKIQKIRLFPCHCCTKKRRLGRD